MKALLLTYDRQVGLAELVVKSYLRLWNGCPFQFLVPRNDDRSPHFEFLIAQKNVTIVPTPISIRSTMSALLERADDEEWIYWCIDDRYPIEIDQRRIEMVFDFIASGAAGHLNAIKLIHWKETANPEGKDIEIGDRQFRFQVPYSAWGFWHHHFLRAKVLKEIFVASEKNAIADTPWALNEYFHKLPFIEVFKSIVFPVGEPIVQYGETLVQGLLLANACEALVRHDCPVPDYTKDPRSVLFQTESSWPDVTAAKAQIFHALQAQRQQQANGQPPASPPRPPPSRVKSALRLVRSWVQRQRP